MSRKSSRVLASQIGRARALHRAGHHKEARTLYEAVLAVDAEQPDALHFLGLLHFHTGDPGTAERLMRRALELEPGNVHFLKNLGNFYLETGRNGEARGCYLRVIDQDPGDATAYNNLCVALRHLGELDNAVEAGHISVRLEPGYALAWFNLGNACKVAQSYREAIECYERATELDPKLTPAHDSLCQSTFRLESQSFLGRRRFKKTIRAYQRWLSHEPESALAAFMLDVFSSGREPSRAPDDVVRNMFDRFAPEFDNKLSKLEYRLPDLLGPIFQQWLGEPQGDLDIVDGGCGTGLCASVLKPYAQSLTGVDLSSVMLEKAAERALYDSLVERELTAYLAEQAGGFDLAVFTDSMIYFGDLSGILSATAGALNSGGRMIMSLEKLSDENVPAGHRLQANGRYVHSRAYVEESLKSCGFSAIECREESIRKEMGSPVHGLIFTASLRVVVRGRANSTR